MIKTSEPVTGTCHAHERVDCPECIANAAPFKRSDAYRGRETLPASFVERRA